MTTPSNPIPELEQTTTPTEGLYPRYDVRRLDGPQDVNADYFVLRLDDGGKDKTWVKGCRKAFQRLIQWMLQCDHLPHLRSDMMRKTDGWKGPEFTSTEHSAMHIVKILQRWFCDTATGDTPVVSLTINEYTTSISIGDVVVWDDQNDPVESLLPCLLASVYHEHLKDHLSVFKDDWTKQLNDVTKAMD